MKSLVFFAAAATAHFGLDFPEWRVDSLAEGDGTINQRIYPCANATPNSGPTTDWPLDGGALKLELHHPWTYVFVNLGTGEDVSLFNVSLTPEFWNATGNGTLCIPKLPLPASLKVKDGDLGSIQVVTVGETGAALYNCADIKFSKDAKALEDCKSNNVTYYVVGEVEDPVESDGDVPEPSGGNSSSGGEDGGSGGNSGGSDDGGSGGNSSGGGGGGGGDGGSGGSGAVGQGVPVMVLSAVVGLAFAFAAGLSL